MPLSTIVRHLVEHLLAPPGDRHVEGIVGAGLRGLVVPHLQRLEQRLAGRRQAEIDHHRGAARRRRPRAALEIIGRIGAHERHFEMGVRVDAAGHHVAAGGVELVIAVQVRPDADDLVVLDQHVGLPGAVGGDDGAVLDDFGHCCSPVFPRSATPPHPAASRPPSPRWGEELATILARRQLSLSGRLSGLLSPAGRGWPERSEGRVRGRQSCPPAQPRSSPSPTVFRPELHGSRSAERNSLRVQPLRAPFVGFRICVLAAIDLDDQHFSRQTKSAK